MTFHKFKITGGPLPADCQIELDGKPLDSVRRLSFEVGHDQITTIKIEMFAEIEFEGEVGNVCLNNASEAG